MGECIGFYGLEISAPERPPRFEEPGRLIGDNLGAGFRGTWTIRNSGTNSRLASDFGGVRGTPEIEDWVAVKEFLI